MCNQSGPTRGPLETVQEKQGLKRKHDDLFCDIYVPPKRISPFLNTPKEKKEERRKILKMSIKKLKQLEDPETFLRRTVLVNNTRKRIQLELKEEKANNKYEFKSKRCLGNYEVVSNGCLSNSYLLDDPFLSGIHEKITDDMTDTLINNLKDKLCDNVVETDSKQMETDSQPVTTEPCQLTQLNSPADSTTKNSSSESLGGESHVRSQCETDSCEIKVERNNVTTIGNSSSIDSVTSATVQTNNIGQNSVGLTERTSTGFALKQTDQNKENSAGCVNSVNMFQLDWCGEVVQEVCMKQGHECKDAAPFQPVDNKQVLSHFSYARNNNLDLDPVLQLYSYISGKEL